MKKNVTYLGVWYLWVIKKGACWALVDIQLGDILALHELQRMDWHLSVPICSAGKAVMNTFSLWTVEY